MLYPAELRVHGGEGGIRTLGTREGTTVFKTVAFDRSATSPCMLILLKINSIFFKFSGGEEGIRTLEPFARITPYQGAAFDRSGTSP